MNIRKNTTEVYAEMERIAKANGGHLTPEAVLKNAKSERSPIHKYFTWDDSEAAKRWRLTQAGMLIRMVKVNVEMHDNDKPLVCRAFVNVASTERNDEGEAAGGVYVPLAVALKVDDYRTQMLENARSELAAFKRKYAVLQELAGVFGEIDKFNLIAA